MNGLKSLLNKTRLSAVFSLALLVACSSDDESSAGSQLLWHASEHSVVSVRADGESILFTSGASLYAISDDNVLTLLRAVSGGPALIEVVAEDTYLLASGRGPTGLRTLDGGETWHHYDWNIGGIQTTLQASKLIDETLYFRFSSGLARTSRDFQSVGLVSGTDNLEYWPEYGMSLVYNQSRDQLWWGETRLSGEEGPQTLINRLDRESGNINTFWADNEPVFIDGSADYYDANVVLLGGQGGLFITHDNGSNWQSYPDDGTDVTIYSVTQHEPTGRFYAFARITDEEVDEIWCSANQGVSWQRSEFGDNDARRATDSMLIMTRDGEEKLIVPSLRGIFEAPLSMFSC